MAIIKKKILGEILGNLGDVIIRTRNGKTVIYSKPSKQKVSKSEVSIKARNKFALTVALAKEIISDETLSHIWRNSKIKATNSYQKIIKHNSKLVSEESLTINNQIVPEGLATSSISLNYQNEKVEIKILSADLSGYFDELQNFYCIIHSWNSNRKLSKKLSQNDYLIRLQIFDLVSQNNNEYFLFSIDLNSSIKLNHDRCIIFSTIVGQKNNKIIWTRSLANLFEI